MKYLLGIDLGTSSVKTILINEQGKLISSATEEYPMLQPLPGWAEQDPSQWWNATAKSIESAILKSGISARDIAGVGLSGQMHGSVFLDKNREVIRPAILWSDQRTAEECQWITEQIGQEKLNHWVGNKALTGFTAPKILWVRKHEPEVYKQIRYVLLPKDYIRFKLTGEICSEVSDSSGTLLFNVVHRNWSRPMLESLDIPEDWLPKVYESEVASATIPSKIARQFGFREDTPVVGGAGDQAAAAIGTGVISPGVVSISLGTSGVLFAPSNQVQIDQQNRLHSFCHAVPGRWHMMGVMLSAAECLKWWKNTVGQKEAEDAALRGISTYELMCTHAALSFPGASGLIFLPYLMGERTPYADPLARGAFIGLTRRHNKADMTRAILEGVAYGLRDSLEIMKELQVPIGQIRLTGGGAKSKLWQQIIADVMGTEVMTMEVDEGPAYGVALLAGISTGLFPNLEEACRLFIKPKEILVPDLQNNQLYTDYYEIYRQLYLPLKGSFQKLSLLEHNYKK